MAEPINRYGQCPICEHNWDGGDILEVLQSLDVFKGKSVKDILKIAEDNYGYTEATKPRFTRLVSIDLLGLHSGKGLWQCPACNNVWDKVTHEHYPSLKGAYSTYEHTAVDELLSSIPKEGEDEDEAPPFEI